MANAKLSLQKFIKEIQSFVGVLQVYHQRSILMTDPNPRSSQLSQRSQVTCLAAKAVRTISTCLIVIKSLSIYLSLLRYPEVCKEGLIYETLHSGL